MSADGRLGERRADVDGTNPFGRFSMASASAYRQLLLSTLDSIDVGLVDRAIDWFESARESGHQIFVCGNGGSASTASHFACDVVKGASHDSARRFRIFALNESVATITAYANDVSYEHVFVEQLKNFVNHGDLFLAISGSGRSRNVVKAMEYAVVRGCRTIALTGRDGGKLGALAELHINVAEQHMGRIEDAHMAICHMIAYSLMVPSMDSLPARLPGHQAADRDTSR
jgi:D-sedoheptulose 7-phosphate isomerase